MLQHQELFSEEIERHQAEARRWAEVDAVGRRAREGRRLHAPLSHAHHSMHTHLRALRMHVRALASPIVMRLHHRAP